ncbi:hypothetical protein A9Q83_06660 [Alphaproteobacteria bacterium 46_93_T64]|nr:hypothetical protein A9Q83_06660 [Alphaproteobacteria bacterium 46_93_T64]
MLYKLLTYSLLTLVLGALIGCQPLERPFQPSQKTSLRSAPGPRASLYVAPVKNGPTEMSEKLATKLQKLGIAAFTGEKVPYRYSISSEITLNEGASFVTWILHDPAGRQTDLQTVQKIGDIVEGPAVFGRNYDIAVLKSASELDIMLGGSGVNFEARQKPAIYVPIVKGAPGDGSETLAVAMQDQIILLGFDVLSEPWKANYVLQGEVSISEPKRGAQIVKILWKLERQNGEYVGKIEQRNRIRAGTLNGPWGPVAKAAAKGGARGIFKLLRQVEADYFKQKS